MHFTKKKKPPIFSRLFYSKFVLFFVGWTAHVLFRLLYSCLRVTVKGYDALLAASNEPLIIALWHDELLLGPMVFGMLAKSNFAVVVSGSRDGHMLARFIETFSHVTTIPVGHKFRHGALLQMVQALQKRVILMITPDGPRGPRHQVKAGVIFSAQQTDTPIIAMRWQASSFWKLKTWDKLIIPKPFSTVTIYFEPSLACPKERNRSELQGELLCALTAVP